MIDNRRFPIPPRRPARRDLDLHHPWVPHAVPPEAPAWSRGWRAIIAALALLWAVLALVLMLVS